MECRKHAHKKQLGATNSVLQSWLLFRHPAVNFWNPDDRSICRLYYNTDLKWFFNHQSFLGENAGYHTSLRRKYEISWSCKKESHFDQCNSGSAIEFQAGSAWILLFAYHQ